VFSQNLEESIYVAAEAFISKQNSISLQLLNKQEMLFKKQVKSKDEQLALVFLQSHKGYYLFEASKLNEAILTYEDAIKRFNENALSEISEFDIIENCLKPLGVLYTKTGDFTNALITINQYIFLAEKSNNTPHQISGGINLAKLYYTLGNHEMVFKTVSSYLENPHANNHQKQKLIEINIDSQIALNLISGYEEITLPQNDTNKSTNYLNIYRLELKNKNYKSALEAFKKHKTHIGLNALQPRKLVQIYIEEAQLHYLLKDTEASLKSLRVALNKLMPQHRSNDLPNKDLLYAENKFIDIFDLYAEIETNPEAALQSLDLSFYVSNLLQNTWTSQETKILNETNNRIRSEKCIDILFNAYNQTKNKTLLFKALQYSENSKVSTLKDVFLKKIYLQRFPNDSLLIKEFNLLKEQERYTSLLVKEGLNSSEINDLSTQLSTISMQMKSLKRIISKKYPDRDYLFSLETLKSQLLIDNAVLTEYFYGKNSIYQFIVSANNITLNQIPQSKKINKTITDFIHLFDAPSTINNDIKNYTNQAFNIYKALNFDALSSYKNVLIIPDGLLNFIPFEALLEEKTNITLFSKMPFVITNQKIVYNSSVLLYLNKINKHDNNTVLGFFPVFENTKQTLTYSIQEAKAIKNEMQSHIFMQTKATKTNFNKKASEYGILHLSTHASSGDFVKPSSLLFYDDTMFLNELYSLDLNTNLVVLSACETGIGKLYKGEGAMSIARGFQYAGVQNLLFSLWQINDLSTSEIMQSFYTNYHQHESAYLANHYSKMAYLENEDINNIKKSPYYWSAFVFYGGLETVKSKNTIFYIIFGLIIILIVLILLLKYRTHE